MRSKLLISGVCLCFALSVTAADDETKALLEAKRIRDDIRIKYGTTRIAGTDTQEKRVQYQIDGAGTFRELKGTPTWAAKDTVSLRYFAFNPLTRGIAASETSEPDPIVKQLADFNVAAVANLTAIFPGAKFASGVTAGKTECAVRREGCETVAPLSQACEVEFRRCACAAIKAKVGDLIFDPADFTGKVTEQTLAEWMNTAVGREGVKKTIKAIKEKGDEEIVERLKKSIAAYNELRALNAESVSAQCGRPTVDPPPPANEKPEDQKARLELQKAIHAAELREEDRVKINRLAEVAAANTAGTKLLESLGALVKFLEPYATSDSWQKGEKGDDTDFEFFTSQPTATEKKTITVAATEKTLALKEGVVTHNAAKPAESKFALRFGRTFVPEVGAAVVYNDIRYPKYKTEEFEGQLIVAQDGYDTANVQAAVTLNGFWDAGSDFFFPGFQLGVSSAKDYPGLLAGFVFRLNRPQRLSLGTGVIVTWHKDLNKLKVGSPVKSAAEIEADLKRRRSPTDWYVALQYTF